jgi:hypothetical protein
MINPLSSLGEEAFLDEQLRDERKREACEAAAVTLIEVRPGYDKEALLEQVATHRWPKVRIPTKLHSCSDVVEHWS